MRSVQITHRVKQVQHAEQEEDHIFFLRHYLRNRSTSDREMEKSLVVSMQINLRNLLSKHVIFPHTYIYVYVTVSLFGQ